MTVMSRENYETNSWQARVLPIRSIQHHNDIFRRRSRFALTEDGPWIADDDNNTNEFPSQISWVWVRLDEIEIAVCVPTDALPISADALDLEITLDAYLMRIEAVTGFDIELIGVRGRPPKSAKLQRVLRLELADASWPVALEFSSEATVQVKRLLDLLPKNQAIPDNLPLQVGLRIGGYATTLAALPSVTPGATILPYPEDISRTKGKLLVAGQPIGTATLDDNCVTLKELTPMQTDQRKSEPTDIDTLSVLPVHLDFVVGNTVLTASDLSDLVAGSVIMLGTQPDTAAVDICVDGRRIGRGELVSIGGRLGVEVSSFAEAWALASTSQDG